LGGKLSAAHAVLSFIMRVAENVGVYPARKSLSIENKLG
jgi:hypothetical protein